MERIFRDNMSELFWLAYILTGDRERSVQAYTGALNSEAPAPALQRFLASWARRLVIVTALGTIRRELRDSMSRVRAPKGDLKKSVRLAMPDLEGMTKNDIEEVLLDMDVFQRCVVILTILEGLPLREAADLLGADAPTVKAAMAQGVTELTWKMAGVVGSSLPGPFKFGRGTMVAFG